MRTIEQIKESIAADFMRNEHVAELFAFTPGDSFTAHFSKVSVIGILFYIFAVAAWTLEKLFDTYRGEVDARIEEIIPHRPRWYRDKVLAFMKGKTLVPDTDRYDTEGMTEDAIAAAENAEAEANRRAESLSLDAAIAEVTRLNPDIRSFDDLFALPEYGDIKKLVGAGYSFGRAYEMATVDRVRQEAKQAAYNAVASKAHMTKTSGSVGDAYTISDRQLENYRQLHPNATRAEAVAAFKKYQPKKGK